MSETKKDLLTSGQAARLFGVAPRTVARWAAQGRVPHQRTAGGHTRRRRADLEALLEGRRP